MNDLRNNAMESVPAKGAQADDEAQGCAGDAEVKPCY